MATKNQNFPPPSTPIAGDNPVNQNWMQFFLALWSRTGTAQGLLSPVAVGYSDPGQSPITAPVGVLNAVDTDTVLANITGASGIPTPTAVGALLDKLFGSAVGSIITRGLTGWTGLKPGQIGQVLTAFGDGAELQWEDTGALPVIADGDILANLSGADATPIAHTVSEVLDYVLGDVQGDILFRGAAGWEVLVPGTAGQALLTGGAAADPAWGTVTPAGGFGFFIGGLMDTHELLGGCTYPTDMQFTNADPLNVFECLVPAWTDADITFAVANPGGVPTPIPPPPVGTLHFPAHSYTGALTWNTSPFTLLADSTLLMFAPSARDPNLAFISGNVNGSPQ